MIAVFSDEPAMVGFTGAAQRAAPPAHAMVHLVAVQVSAGASARRDDAVAEHADDVVERIGHQPWVVDRCGLALNVVEGDCTSLVGDALDPQGHVHVLARLRHSSTWPPPSIGWSSTVRRVRHRQQQRVARRTSFSVVRRRVSRPQARLLEPIDELGDC